MCEPTFYYCVLSVVLFAKSSFEFSEPVVAVGSRPSTRTDVGVKSAQDAVASSPSRSC